MKMAKSLLLGTAAGLVAIAGASAAHLPDKAKPVQFVQVDSFFDTGWTAFYVGNGFGAMVRVNCDNLTKATMFQAPTAFDSDTLSAGRALKDLANDAFGIGKTAILVDPIDMTKKTYGSVDPLEAGAGFNLTQKLMSSTAYYGSASSGFVNVDAEYYVGNSKASAA
jgi:hypothetical protein